MRDWVARGWAAPWDGIFERRGVDAADMTGAANADLDFFGCPPPRGESLFVGVGGMHILPRRIVHAAQCADNSSPIKLHSGVRVKSIELKEAGGGTGGRWRLHGQSGAQNLGCCPFLLAPSHAPRVPALLLQGGRPTTTLRRRVRARRR